MPVATEVATLEKFRASYLYSGNASKSARAVGMPESTGRDFARTLATDSAFVAQRRALRANFLDETEAALREVLATSLERFQGGMPEVPTETRGPVTIVDKRSDYGSLIVNTHRTIVGRTRLDSEKAGEVPTGVALVVVTKGEVEAKPAAEPEKP